MKLYTEEQVIELLSNMLLTTEQVESIFEELTPIELPSDKEIDNAATHLEPSVTRRAFQSGAKWMRDKILNK